MPPNTKAVTDFPAQFGKLKYDPTFAAGSSYFADNGSEVITNTVTLQSTQPGQVTTGKAEMSGENNSIGALDAEYKFIVTMQNPVPRGTIMKMNVPDPKLIPAAGVSGF